MQVTLNCTFLGSWGQGNKARLSYSTMSHQSICKEMGYQTQLTVLFKLNNFIKPFIKHRNWQPFIVDIATYWSVAQSPMSKYTKHTCYQSKSGFFVELWGGALSDHGAPYVYIPFRFIKIRICLREVFHGRRTGMKATLSALSKEIRSIIYKQRTK